MPNTPAEAMKVLSKNYSFLTALEGRSYWYLLYFLLSGELADDGIPVKDLFVLCPRGFFKSLKTIIKETLRVRRTDGLLVSSEREYFCSPPSESESYF